MGLDKIKEIGEITSIFLYFKTDNQTAKRASSLHKERDCGNFSWMRNHLAMFFDSD